MKSREYVRKADALAFEEPLFEIPLRKEYLLKEIGRGKRVLDLGCLGGQLSQLIKNQNNDVFGVEANRVVISGRSAVRAGRDESRCQPI